MTLAATLLKLAGEGQREPLNEDCIAFLRANGVSEDLVVTLNACAFASPLRVGRLWLSCLADAERENLDDQNAPCIRNGLLIVGSGLNGDPIAIELQTGKMAFISHDMLWEGDYESFDEVVARSPLTFEEFWLAALADPDFPRDSYAADERWPAPSAAG